MRSVITREVALFSDSLADFLIILLATGDTERCPANLCGLGFIIGKETAPILITFAASLLNTESLLFGQTSACWYLGMKKEISLAFIRHPRRPPPSGRVYRSISISIDPTMQIFSEPVLILYLASIFGWTVVLGLVTQGAEKL